MQVACHQMTTGRQESIEPFHLGEKQGAAYLVQAVVVTHVHHVICICTTLVPIKRQTRHPVRAQPMQSCSDCWVIGCDRSAFTASQVLVGKETETATPAPSPAGAAMKA